MARVTKAIEKAKAASMAAARKLQESQDLWEAALGEESDRASDAEDGLRDIGGLLRRMPLASLREEVDDFFLARRIIEAQGRAAILHFAQWARLDRAAEQALAKIRLDDLPNEHERVAEDVKKYLHISDFFARLARRLEQGLKDRADEIEIFESKRKR